MTGRLPVLFSFKGRNVPAIPIPAVSALSSAVIDGVNFNAANYSAAIQANDTANTQKVLDAICNMRSEWKESKIAEQSARIQALETQQYIGAATANLVHNPIPAYSVQPPFFNQPIYGTTF